MRNVSCSLIKCPVVIKRTRSRCRDLRMPRSNAISSVGLLGRYIAAHAIFSFDAFDLRISFHGSFLRPVRPRRRAQKSGACNVSRQSLIRAAQPDSPDRSTCTCVCMHTCCVLFDDDDDDDDHDDCVRMYVLSYKHAYARVSDGLDPASRMFLTVNEIRVRRLA